jgi:acyl-CoA synthetase (AMP-forming)/AMP-acid ligase II
MSWNWHESMVARGDAIALIEDGEGLNYADLARRIESTEHNLREQGVSAQDTVVLNCDWSIAGICAFFALARLGAIIAPITNLTAAAVETMNVSCGARFVYRPQHESLELWQPTGASPALYDHLRERNAAGLVLLSSGSTGKPKAVLHDLHKLFDSKQGMHRSRQLKILLLLMFDHIGGINTLINTVFSGGTAVIAAQRTPEVVCSLIQNCRIQVLPGNPTFLNLILMGRFHEHFDLSSLRLITYGTEPMPQPLLIRLRAAFPKVRLLQTFGTSETGIASTQSASSESVRFKFNDTDYEHRVVDGELQLRSKTQFLGYLSEPGNAVTEDGWFRTGDLVHVEDDGYLRVLGRAKEIINVGGEKVLPIEIESLLLEHPLVADCVVYGEANAITGQMVCADIQPTREVDKAELRRTVQEFLATKVERFKIPTRIKLVATVETSERAKKRRIRV